jgi:TPR repeat protein
MYESGHGVRQDYAEAVRWYRKAADQGDLLAQAKLGTIHELDRGVPEDYRGGEMVSEGGRPR